MTSRTVRPRIRCPCCGRLTWPSQLKKHYNVEIIANIYYGGRANKNWYVMQPFNDIQMLIDAKKFLAERCLRISQELGILIPRETTIDLMSFVKELPVSQALPMEVEYA